jgi:GTPase
MSYLEGSFIDRIRLRLKAGDGGRGVISFRHEKFVPLGGPDGGDGGDGGSIILRVNSGLNTLDKLHSQPFYRAENAESGGKNNRSGANGESLILEVPPGTVVKDEDTGEIVVDMEETGGETVVVKGGDGGKGNARFATPTNQAPHRATPGYPGEERNVIFELKTVAHAGLIGLPNAGKSTLISAITGARPKIANYPFTTLQPILGAISLIDGSSLVVADIPGIIQGAHEGIGLGLDFLRHIERTKMLVYVIEISPSDPSLIAQTLKDLQHELRQYDASILNRPFLIALNKADLLDDAEEEKLVLQLFQDEFPQLPRESIFLISAMNKDRTEILRQAIIQLYSEINAPPLAKDSHNRVSELHSS